MIPEANEGLARYLEMISRYDALTDDEARSADAETLVLTTLRLVVSIAKRNAKTTDELLDRIQDGNLGLIQAAKTYIPAEGTWASWAIGYIKGEIRNQRRDGLGKRIRQREDLPEVSSIDVEGGADLHNAIANQDQHKPIYDVLTMQALEMSGRILTQKQHKVLGYRLAGLTYKSIACRMGCTRQAVQCVEKTAIKKMRAAV